MSGGDFDRLERAIAVFTSWEDAGMAPSADELLRQHEDLREVLEPLLAAVESGEEPAPDDDAPTELGGFRIEHEIGRGGMGVVYAARQVALDRQVALKVLPNDRLLDPRAVARFRRESALLASLRHPSLVEVLTVGRERGCEFFAMALIDGVPLSRILQRLGGERPEQLDGERLGSTVERLFADAPPRFASANMASPAATSTEAAWQRGYFEAAVRLAWQVADALAHAHEAGVLHRDVKSSNILVCRDGRAVLTDFGLAREVGRPSLTQSGEFAGTPYYAAPEQVLGRSSDLDGRADVFALGVVLYELLTLRRPFTGANSHEVAQAVVTQEPVAPSTHSHRVPADLSAITLRALEKDPRRRYQTAREFADDLDAFLGHRPVKARRAGPLRRLQRYVRREPWRATLALVLLLAVPSITFLAGYLQARAPELAAGEVELTGRRIDDLLERAAMLRELGDRGVEPLLAEALALYPRHPDTIGMLVWSRCDKGAGMSRDEFDRLVAPAALRDDERARLLVPVLTRLGQIEEATALQRELPPPQTAIAAFYAGLAALAAGHASGDKEAFARAVDAFELAVLLSPRRRALYLDKLAHALGHEGDRRRRALVAEALASGWPDSATQQYWSYFAEKDSDMARARQRLGRAIELRNDLAALHYNLGTSLVRSARYREAVAPLHRATELSPDYAPGHANLAQALFFTGDNVAALAAIERAIELDGDNAMFHANRGQFLAGAGKLVDARAAHEHALKLDAHQAIAIAGLAWLTFNQQGAEACREFCAGHVAAGNTFEEVYRYLALSLTTLRRYDEAIAAASEGIARFPDSPWLHMRRAHAQKHVDRPAAIADARRAVALLPAHPTMHETLGSVLGAGNASADELAEALRAYERQGELDPRNGLPTVNGAVILLRLGRRDEAVERVRSVVERMPGWGTGHEKLGALLLDLGRLDEAITALEAGIVHAPGQAPVAFRLAFALQRRAAELMQRGEIEAAVVDARRGLEVLTGSAGGDAESLRRQLQTLVDQER